VNCVPEEDSRNKLTIAEKQGKPLLELIGVPASILAILTTAAIYGAGTAFRAGYLYQFGFDSGQIPTDFYDTLYWGYARGTPLVFAWLVYSILGLALAAILYWVGSALRRRLNRSKAVRQFSARFAIPTISPTTPIKLIAVAVLIACFLYPLFLSFIAMGKMYEYGVMKGKQRIADFEADAAGTAAKTETHWIEIHFSSPAPRVERGYRLLCTENLCSIYDPATERKGVRLVSLEGMGEIRVFSERPQVSEVHQAGPHAKEASSLSVTGR
jgi:hypothetical protein